MAIAWAATDRVYMLLGMCEPDLVVARLFRLAPSLPPLLAPFYLLAAPFSRARRAWEDRTRGARSAGPNFNSLRALQTPARSRLRFRFHRLSFELRATTTLTIFHGKQQSKTSRVYSGCDGRNRKRDSGDFHEARDAAARVTKKFVVNAAINDHCG